MEIVSSMPPDSPRVRGAFLTVICILTFIGSGWGIIKSITRYAGADTIAALASEAIKDAGANVEEQNARSFAKLLMNSAAESLNADNIRKSAIFEFLSNILTLGGAILMWNRKKIGFYMYIAGILVLIAVPFAMGRLLGAIGASFIGFIGVVFIVMYAVNLKYMNK